MNNAEFISKRDSLCNSLKFLVDECQDANDPFFLATAAMLLQISAHLKLADPSYSMQLLDAMMLVSKKEFQLEPEPGSRNSR